MSAGRTAIAAAALIMIASWCVYLGFRPGRVTVAGMRARFGDRLGARAGGSDGADASMLRSVGESLAGGAVGRWVHERLGSALLLADTTLPDVLGRMVGAAVIGAGSVMLVAVGGAATGAAPLSPFWIVPIVFVPVMFVVLQFGSVRDRAARRRRELERVINDFVQLTAVALTTNRSVEEAIGFAAEAGEGFAFDLLRRTVATADPMGVPVWAALSTMADTYGLDDLRGLCSSLEHQASAGVAVATTMRNEAKAIRQKQLVALAAAADEANSNLSIPTMGMVIGMVLFLGYPITQQVLQAFNQ